MADLNQLAKSIVDKATDEDSTPEKDPAAVERGRKGGLSKAARTSAAERSSDARRAVQARWDKERATG